MEHPNGEGMLVVHRLTCSSCSYLPRARDSELEGLKVSFLFPRSAVCLPEGMRIISNPRSNIYCAAFGVGT